MSKLSTLGEVLNGCQIPKDEGQYPAYGGNGIITYVDKWNYPENTIIIGRVGANCGAVHYSPSKCWVTDNALAFKCNDKNDSYFVFSLLKMLKLNNFHIGSSQPLITQTIINSINYDFIQEHSRQSKIGKFIHLLDSKLESNNKINSELEAMAKTLYDYWFLQFEFPNEEGKPYKSSGGKMVYNEELKREIPEGWGVKHLKDLLYLGNNEKYDGENLCTIDLSVMPSNSISLNQINESKNFDTNLFKMKKFDILFGSIRPYLKKGGIAPCDGAFAGTVHCFRCYDNDFYNYALLTLCTNNMFDYAYKNSKGSKMPVIGSDRILDYPIPFNERTLKKFNFFDIKSTIAANIMQNQELASLRDFLLPLLMNGQVTFKN